MPEVDQIMYNLKEVTALMLRDRGIRSGLWMISTRIAHTVTNVAPPQDEPGGLAGPAVVSVVVEVGIQRASVPGPLTVDASEVWKEQKPRRVAKRAAKAK